MLGDKRRVSKKRREARGMGFLGDFQREFRFLRGALGALRMTHCCFFYRRRLSPSIPEPALSGKGRSAAAGEGIVEKRRAVGRVDLRLAEKSVEQPPHDG